MRATNSNKTTKHFYFLITKLNTSLSGFLNTSEDRFLDNSKLGFVKRFDLLEVGIKSV